MILIKVGDKLVNGLALCDYKECEKSCNCKRYEEKAESLQGYHVEFNLICNENTGYPHFTPKEESIVKEVNNEKETI